MSKPTDEAAVVSATRHVLPKDLPNAIKHLSDEELDRLITAALAEMRQRGRRLPTDKAAPKIKPGLAKASLTRGQLNAVRAAFKAGVTPSRIARQFGLSQSDVRKALATDHSGEDAPTA
jgi:DNA invertase Pin-like site-specific DNA recombinase